MKKSENLFLEFNQLHHLLATQFLFGVSFFFYHPPEMFIVMGFGRAMPHGGRFKRYTFLALQEKNIAAREMTCLGVVFTVIMHCIAELTRAAMLVTRRAALNKRLAVFRSKSVGFGLEYAVRGQHEAQN